MTSSALTARLAMPRSAGQRYLLAAGAFALAVACVTAAADRVDQTNARDAFVLAVLALASLSDIKRRIIPNSLVVPASLLVLAADALTSPGRLLEDVASSLAAGTVFLLFARVWRGGLGMGDVKLVAFIGAALGAAVLPALVVGTAAAGVVSAAIIMRHGFAARQRTIPLGPFLGGGAIVGLLFF